MKLRNIFLFLFITALVCSMFAFAVCCTKKQDSTVSDSSHESGDSSGKIEYPDRIEEISDIEVTATSGEGYFISYPASLKRGEELQFEVTVYDNFSKDTAVVTVNGNKLSGNNGIYRTAVSQDKAEIVVSGIKRTHYSVEYIDVKGVSYNGAKRIAVGKSLEFTVSLDADAIKKDNFKILANGSEISGVNGKYTVNNIAKDLRITAQGVDYPKYSVTAAEGEGYKLKTNVTEVYKGDDLFVFVELEKDYVLKSEPRVFANGTEIQKNESGVFVLKNVSQNVLLTVNGIERIGSYTVSFENTEEQYPELEVMFGETVGEIAQPAMNGRTFKGWSVNGELVALENYVITNDTVLVALWNYNYKSPDANADTIHAFTKEEVEEIGKTLPDGFKVGYGKNHYSQNADWEAFRVQDNKDGAAFTVTFPKFEFNKYGYTEFRFSTIWSTKNVYYNGTKLASVTNGGNLDNYLEIFVSGGYIGCGSVKVALQDGVYNGTASLILNVDNGRGRHGIFSDFYTYRYDYTKYISAIKDVDENTTVAEATELIGAYKLFKNFLTPYEKSAYSFIDAKIGILKDIVFPMSLCEDGSYVSAKVGGEEKNPNNANDTPGGQAAELGSSKRWTMTNITEIDLILRTVSLDEDEKIVYKIAFQSSDFQYTVSIGGVEMLVANTNLDVITIEVCGNGTVTVSAKNQGVTKTTNIDSAVIDGTEPLTVKVTKSADWGNLYVSHSVVILAK